MCAGLQPWTEPRVDSAMRPLTLILLALVVVVAVLFGVMAMSGDRAGRGNATAQSPAQRQASDLAPARPLSAPERVAAEPVGSAAEATRAAVQTVDPGRERIPGRLHGLVVNAHDEPVPEARLILLDAKSSLIGEALHLVQQEELPEPVAEVFSNAAGEFEFPAVRPGSWTLVVTASLVKVSFAGLARLLKVFSAFIPVQSRIVVGPTFLSRRRSVWRGLRRWPA